MSLAEARRFAILSCLGIAVALALTGCVNDGRVMSDPGVTASDGPANQGPDPQNQMGNTTSGRDVFRFETFGN